MQTIKTYSKRAPFYNALIGTYPHFLRGNAARSRWSRFQMLRDNCGSFEQSMTVSTTKFRAGLCVASAFVPLLIMAWDIHRDAAYSEWQMLFNLVNLTALLWLGLTVFPYLRTRTRNAAWLFALFPIAFVEPVLLFCLWFSVRFSPK